jgi:serine/threonine protein kinase
VARESASGQAGWLLAALSPGTVVAGYRLEARIGAGGMAVVFRARDEGLGRTVALKVLAPALAGDGWIVNEASGVIGHGGTGPGASASLLIPIGSSEVRVALASRPAHIEPVNALGLRA